MPSYVCTQLSNANLITGQRTCQAWVEFVPPVATASNSPWEQLNNLSQAEATALLTQTVVLWAFAWGWNFLGKFINR